MRNEQRIKAHCAQRTKEIGIRKAMGASRLDILRFFVWQFARPVLWANLIAWPCAYVLMRHWLDGFGHHVSLSPLTFLAVDDPRSPQISIHMLSERLIKNEGDMYSIAQMLTAAGVSSSEWPKGFGVIRLTAGHQLIGTYAELMKYRNANPEYQGWEIHHILEALDIERLGLAAFSPAYEDQICVLIPAPAHHRINSVLRRANPTSLSATVPELEAAYRDAYKIIGNYCGSSEAAVSQELFGLFKAVLSNLVAAETDARSTQINNAVFALQVLENKIAAGKSLHEKLIRGMTPSIQEKMIFFATAPFIGELAIFTAAGQAVVGKAVNKVNPVPRPPMSIWVKAEVSAQRARRALARGDLGEAGSDIVLADTHFRIADEQITAWRNGIDLAGRKAQLGIGASAVVASIVAISVFAPDVPAVVGTGVRVAEQTPTGVRIAAEVERGVRVVLLAQTSAEEQVGEAIITEEVPKLLLQALPLPK